MLLTQILSFKISIVYYAEYTIFYTFSSCWLVVVFLQPCIMCMSFVGNFGCSIHPF